MKVALPSHIFRIMLWASMVLVGWSCSRTKDRAINRTYHQMTSRFNPLFNGQEAFDEALKSLQNEHVDVYDRVLAIYPWGQAKEGSAAAADLKRAVEKATKTIQDHSMMFRATNETRWSMMPMCSWGTPRL